MHNSFESGPFIGRKDNFDQPIAVTSCADICLSHSVEHVQLIVVKLPY